MTEMQEAIQSLYKACKVQYGSKDSCLACPLCDKDAVNEEGGSCLANHPCVWDAFYPWLKAEDSAEISAKKYAETELKPCPFCGATEEVSLVSLGVIFWCECEMCGAKSAAADTREEAAAYWNQRRIR